MRQWISKILFFVLALIITGQALKASFVFSSKNVIELTWEESEDGEAEEDLDDDEIDKTICAQFYSIGEASVSCTHYTHYQFANSKLVEEIIPPPPKA